MDRLRPDTFDSDAEAETATAERTLEGDSFDGEARGPAQDEPLARGSTVGRYTVLEKIGAGGMGVVYAAFDPQLDRKVALKVMHPQSSGLSHSRGGRQRLLREAQAMAKLSHPNVITVHDVGTFGERVFVAMEFIEGCTLREWLTAHKRDWTDVVEAFVRAGRGLAAAHAAGLVHRDFKPDNVLMGLMGSGRDQTDGRIIVMDFGLARQTSTPAAKTPYDVSTRNETPAANDLSLTRTGALLGTPAYMAPEQHKGDPIGPAADQFSFCVALWEGLYGERPFGGTNVTSVAMNVLEGRVRPPPRDAQVPAWLRDVLIRGLSVAPSDRYASMDALLAELQRDPPQSSRPWLAAVVAIAVAGSMVGIYAWRKAATAPTCDDAAAQVEQVWNDERRRRLREALAVPLPYADASVQSVEALVDDYAGRWAAVYGEACAARVRSRRTNAKASTLGEGDGMRCATARLQELDALLDAYAFAPDQDVMDHAVAAALALTPPERCTQSDAARASIGREAVVGRSNGKTRRIADELPTARAMLLTGRSDLALERARPLSELAGSAGDPVLEAEVLLVLARAHAGRGELGLAERHLRRAVLAASAAGQGELEARAWLEMVEVVGLRQHAIVDGRRLSLAAESSIQRAGDPPHLRAELSMLLGAMHQAEGNDSEALREFDRALRIRRDRLPANPLALASAREGVGIALDGLGRHAEAVEHHAAVLSVREQLLGTQHPLCGTALSHLGAAMLGANELRRATATLVRARMILDPDGDVALDDIPEAEVRTTSTPVPDSPSRHARQLAVVLDRLGLTMRGSEKLEAAFRLHSLSGATLAALPGHGRDLAYPLGNLGLALTELGRADEALPPLRRALELAESTLAPGHQDRGLLHLNLANAAWAVGDVEDARTHYEHALRIWEDISDEHRWLSYALTGLGRTRLAADDAPAAVELLERAYDLRDHEQEDSMNLAETSLLLARALWATQRNPERALELAMQARDLARASEPANVSDLERLLSGAQIFGLSDRLVPAGLGLIDRRHPPR